MLNDNPEVTEREKSAWCDVCTENDPTGDTAEHAAAKCLYCGKYLCVEHIAEHYDRVHGSPLVKD